jgi:hypothetical protein
MADAELTVPVAEQRELADQQVHQLEVVDGPGVLGRQVPVRGPAHALGQGQHGAHDHLAAADALAPGLQAGRAARHEHLEPGRKGVHPVVQGRHRPVFRGVLPGPRGEFAGAQRWLGRLLRRGEGGGHGLLHDRHGRGELERLRPGVLPGHDRLEVAVRPHEPAGGGDVLSDAVHIAVQVHAEQVERVPAGLGQVVEELPGLAARLAAEHVVAAAAEDDRRRRVGLLDRAVHGRELLDVLRRGARPEQAGVARLVVTLPVPDPATAVPDHLADEPGVRVLVEGGRGRQEVGRLAGPPARARAQRDPELGVVVELAEEGVDRVPAVLAGLRFHL